MGQTQAAKENNIRINTPKATLKNRSISFDSQKVIKAAPNKTSENRNRDPDILSLRYVRNIILSLGESSARVKTKNNKKYN